MTKSYWLWYPGDMELYFAMKQNFSRVERGFSWPAFWKSEGFRNRVVFRRTYLLEEETEFRVTGRGEGFFLVGEAKYPFGKVISAPRGEVSISIHCARIEAFPAVYIEGEIVCSDQGWMASDYCAPARPAGFSEYFTDPWQDPSVWEYSEKVYSPVSAEKVFVEKDDKGNVVETRAPGPGAVSGYLYTFETELTAMLEVLNTDGTPIDMLDVKTMQVCCGESREEALDMLHCYYSWHVDAESGRCPRCAFRYVFIPGRAREVYAIHQFVDIPVRSFFKSGDGLLNRIWEVAAHTFSLCSGIFFIDGAKRDKWIWCGDAYQSICINPYIFADPSIDRRTLTALRGNDPMTTHINTITDYTMLWVFAVWQHCITYHDLEYLASMYAKMQSLMDFLKGQTDENGFFTGRSGDWIYVDWADLDKEGPLGAEQMLYAGCWKIMSDAASLLGREGDAALYEERYLSLKAAVEEKYWNEEKGAYVDSFTSGRRNVSRQTNIFALRCGLADEERRKKIIANVILNSQIPAVTTPYFAFYELDELGREGMTEALYDRMVSYWGGMLARGAVTFWEEFDPMVPISRQYDMYGDRFGKSLCHAWAASPLYLIGRYLVGLSHVLTDQGETGFVLSPSLDHLGTLDCAFQVCGGEKTVRIRHRNGILRISTDAEGGLLILGGKEIPLLPDREFQAEI